VGTSDVDHDWPGDLPVYLVAQSVAVQRISTPLGSMAMPRHTCFGSLRASRPALRHPGPSAALRMLIVIDVQRGNLEVTLDDPGSH
jgi:hypothetical protein